VCRRSGRARGTRLLCFRGVCSRTYVACQNSKQAGATVKFRTCILEVLSSNLWVPSAAMECWGNHEWLGNWQLLYSIAPHFFQANADDVLLPYLLSRAHDRRDVLCTKCRFLPASAVVMETSVTSRPFGRAQLRLAELFGRTVRNGASVHGGCFRAQSSCVALARRSRRRRRNGGSACRASAPGRVGRTSTGCALVAGLEVWLAVMGCRVLRSYFPATGHGGL
jgi:hypothetical protein